MTTFPRPAADSILGLSSDDVSKKTWKHFYAPREAWDRVVRADVAALRAEGEEAAGFDHARNKTLSDDTDGRRPFLDLVAARHHEEHYGPAYRAVLADADTLWEPHASEERKWQLLAANSIFVSIAVADPHFVITAFRPVPGVRGVPLDDEELRAYAEDYFMRKTGHDL